MQRKWDSITELDFCNRAYAIFERYRIEQSLFPEIKDGEYYIAHRDQVAELINEMIELCRTEHPLWNFPKFPHES